MDKINKTKTLEELKEEEKGTLAGLKGKMAALSPLGGKEIGTIAIAGKWMLGTLEE